MLDAGRRSPIPPSPRLMTTACGTSPRGTRNYLSWIFESTFERLQRKKFSVAAPASAFFLNAAGKFSLFLRPQRHLPCSPPLLLPKSRDCLDARFVESRESSSSENAQTTENSKKFHPRRFPPLLQSETTSALPEAPGLIPWSPPKERPSFARS